MSSPTLRLPERTLEIVPLADRLRWMLAVRRCVVSGSIVACSAARPWPTAPERSLLMCGVLLLSGSLLLHPLAVRGTRLARWALPVPVLLDGLYLAWALYLTGGVSWSPCG